MEISNNTGPVYKDDITRNFPGSTSAVVNSVCGKGKCF